MCRHRKQNRDTSSPASFDLDVAPSSARHDEAPQASMIDAGTRRQNGRGSIRQSICPIPRHIGPCEFSKFGLLLIAVKSPREFDPLMRQAGGEWEPGSKRWLITRRRLGPLVRGLLRVTDPLFRHARMSLDEF